MRFSAWSALSLAFVLSAVPALAEQPNIYIFDVVRRPTYKAAYERMIEGQGELPRWMADPVTLTAATATPGAIVKVAGDDQEAFAACEPHRCSDSKIVVLFSEFGDVAKALLIVGNHERYLGNPSPTERRVLAAQNQ